VPKAREDLGVVMTKRTGAPGPQKWWDERGQGSQQRNARAIALRFSDRREHLQDKDDRIGGPDTLIEGKKKKRREEKKKERRCTVRPLIRIPW